MKLDAYEKWLLKMYNESLFDVHHYNKRNEVNEHGANVVADYCDADLTQWYDAHGRYDAFTNALWTYRKFKGHTESLKKKSK